MDKDPRYSGFTQLIDLVVYLMGNSKGITTKEIMKMFECSRSTAERKRECLVSSTLGIGELYTDSHLEKHWGFLELSPSMRNIVSFTPDDIANLKLLKAAAPKAKADSAGETIKKIEAVCASKKISVDDEIEALLRTEYVVNKQKSNYKVDVNVLKTITEAIRTSCKLKGEYNGKDRIWQPLGLISKDKTYLVAREESKDGGKEVFNYFLHKITDVHNLHQPFDRNGFDLKAYSNRSFGAFQDKELLNVELLFDKSVANDVVCYNFHPTQSFVKQKDGSVIVKFTAGGKSEIIWHLFTWGDKVKILAPTSLKEFYRENLEKVLKNLG